MTGDAAAPPRGSDRRDGVDPAGSAADTQVRRPSDAEGGRPLGLWDRLRGRGGDEPRRRDPWRVEGMPKDPSARAPNQRPRQGGIWWWLIAVLTVNWIVASVAMGPPPRTSVSYTFFSDQ